MSKLQRISKTTKNGWLSMGGASFGNLYRMLSDADCMQTLQTAWDNGIRYFDTAPYYGKGLSEHRMGHFLSTKNRADFVLSTKVGRLLQPLAPNQAPDDDMFIGALPNTAVYNYSYDGIMQSIQDSLKRLNLYHIDIAFVHDIGELTHGECNEKHWHDLIQGGGFKALNALKADGTIGAFGLGVNEKEICIECLKHMDLDTILLAGRYTLLEQHSLNDLLVTCEQKNTEIVIGGVFNSGMLATPKRSENLMYNYKPAPDYMVKHMSDLYDLCASYNVPLPAVAIQFCNAHPVVQSVLLGTGSMDKLTTNIEWANTLISDDFWYALRNSGLIAENAPLPIDT